MTASFKARVAVLVDQIYFGLGEPIALVDLPKGARVFGEPAIKDAIAELVAADALEDVVWIERDCDLPIGRYKLVPPDGGRPWRFEPLRPAPGDASQHAFYELCLVQHKCGFELPLSVVDWCVSWESRLGGQIDYFSKKAGK